MTTTVGARVRICRQALKMSQLELAKLAGLTQPTISSLERGGSNTSGSLASIADALGVSALWLETGLGEKTLSLGRHSTPIYTDAAGGERSMVYSIPMLESRGSCGNGRHSFCDGNESDYRAPVTVCARLIERFNANPARLISLYADGDSMANYIMDGDIMFFTLDMDGLQSGSIYLLDTPDGLRVKRVQKRLDGDIIIRSDNPDKGRYPDEIYTPDQAALLTFRGKFVLRIGG